MAKRRVNKKIFDCLHRGFGKYCHRCEGAARLEFLNKDNMTPEMQARIDHLRDGGRLSDSAANRRKMIESKYLN